MTPKQFVHYMKGFVLACHDFQPTPKQWDLLKEVLQQVSESSENTHFEVETNNPPSPYSKFYVTTLSSDSKKVLKG